MDRTMILWIPMNPGMDSLVKINPHESPWPMNPSTPDNNMLKYYFSILDFHFIFINLCTFPLTIMGNPAAVEVWTLPPAGKKGREDPLIFLVVQQYDMVYWCEATFGLYLGYLKTTQKLLKKENVKQLRSIDLIKLPTQLQPFKDP